MSKIITTTVYTFDELSEQAKDKARDWYRQGALDYEWCDFVYEDAGQIGLKLTGFDLDRNLHATGSLQDTPEAVIAKILAKHGPSCGTHQTAVRYQSQLMALQGDDLDEVEEARETLAEEFERELLHDYAKILQEEHEYLLSNEAVDGSIEANGYTFTESGKRFS